MNRRHRLIKSIPTLLLPVLLAATAARGSEDVNWLHQYNGHRPPQEQDWAAVGGTAAGARMVDGALRIVDDSFTEAGAFRVAFTLDPGREIIVEARIRFESLEADGRRLRMGFEEGAPVSLLVSDGRQQEGILLYPDRVMTFLDRAAMMDTKAAFHTYRLVIRGRDMSVEVDGMRRIRGEGAIWKPADSPEAFVQFGSNSRKFKGAAQWAYVRVGLRRPEGPPATPKLRVTVGEPWDIPPPIPGLHQTRPYVDDVGGGMLLMSVAQGGDVVYLPYGLLKSTDLGKTWQAVEGLQVKSFGPRKSVRLPDGSILGVSRWTAKYDHEGDGGFIGMSYHLDPLAKTFRMFENITRIPDDLGMLGFDRDIFRLGKGEIIASAYGSVTNAPNRRRNVLVKSADGGATWNHYATVGDNPEPAYAWLSPTEMTMVARVAPRRPMVQKWSHDSGRTWTAPVTLEEASVDPGLLLMSNGVLACCYGRPGSNLMFSLDGGKTWGHHQVISGEHGFNYTAIREVSPGRLLYVHDAPRLRAIYVDVERLD